MAALTANAAAFEFELFPADSFRGIFSGNGFALFEKGALDKINVNVTQVIQVIYKQIHAN